MGDDQEFDALLEQSSLGSPGARRLSERTPLRRADEVRMIIELLGGGATDSGYVSSAEDAARELAKLALSINNPGWLFRLAADAGRADNLVKLAMLRERAGDLEGAEVLYRAAGHTKPLDLSDMPPEFTAFCELHRPRYLSYARVRFHEPAVAGRIVDRAFCTLAEVWPEVLGSSNPTAMAWQILRRTVAEWDQPNSEPLTEHRPTAADEDLASLHYVMGLTAPEITDAVGTETASVAGQHPPGPAPDALGVVTGRRNAP
ncbi:hypothetical protein ACFU6K_00030 [Kitasatospora sp. NPDC057512]|uniref:hypothetical protein n=1 Tax=Kitasatospora sp. NPDC057512 TaxID=3346154 RepID=UPI0036859DD0